MNAIALHATSRPANRDDRRKYLRYAVRCECWLESDEASVFGSTVDVGMGGLFLRTAVPLTQGQRVWVALHLADRDGAVVAEGLVTRAVRARLGQRHGVGVEFLQIRDGVEGLTRFLSGR